MESSVQFQPPIQLKQTFNISAVQKDVDEIQETAKKMIDTYGSSSKKQTHTNFFQRHFTPIYFVDNSTRIGYFNNQGNSKPCNDFLRLVVGIVATIGVLIGAESLGKDMAVVAKCKGMARNAKSIRSEAEGTYLCIPGEKALSVAKKSKQLSGRVLKHTLIVDIAPKITTVAGCVFGVIGAVFNLPAAMAIGFSLGIVGLAGKLFVKKALEEEETKIKQAAHTLIAAIIEYHNNENEPTLPAYNPELIKE